MRAIHIVTTRLSSSFIRPVLLDFVSCSPLRQFSTPRRFICAASKVNGGGRSGSIVAPLVVNEEFQNIDVNPPKGTRDFPPEDMRLRNWLFNHFKEVRELHELYVLFLQFFFWFDEILNTVRKVWHFYLFILLWRSHGYLGMRKWIFQYWRRRHCSSEKLGRRLETKFVFLRFDFIRFT